MTPIPEIRSELEPAVVGGLLDPEGADEVAESIYFVGVLCERAVITRRLAGHLINTMALKKADELRDKQRRERWTSAH